MTATPSGDYDYETGGQGYELQRRADPRIEQVVHQALGDARTVLNVGAGAGSYEPTDRVVFAVEPSAAMRARRPSHSPAIAAFAESLPFDDDAFEASMAMVTVHQWSDWEAGVRELARVSSGPVVIMTFDRDAFDRFWLAQYVDGVITVEATRFPRIDDIVRVLAEQGHTVDVLDAVIPLDCTDGFSEAFYGRPEAFLDPAVRAAQSMWGFIDPDDVAAALERLRSDLADGSWDERFGHLRTQPGFVGSIRLIVRR